VTELERNYFDVWKISRLACKMFAGRTQHQQKGVEWRYYRNIARFVVHTAGLQCRLATFSIKDEVLGDVTVLCKVISMFLFKNKHPFPVNTEIHHHATRQQSNFHQPPAYLTKYQKGIWCLGIKVFNKLPPYIKDEFENIRRFKRRLKNFLHERSFYSLQEYFDLRN